MRPDPAIDGAPDPARYKTKDDGDTTLSCVGDQGSLWLRDRPPWFPLPLGGPLHFRRADHRMALFSRRRRPQRTGLMPAIGGCVVPDARDWRREGDVDRMGRGRQGSATRLLAKARHHHVMLAITRHHLS